MIIIVVSFLIGFLGRSSTWSLIRKLVFPEHVGLVYLSTYEDCSLVDYVIVEDYMADLVRNCNRTYVLRQPAVVNIIDALLMGLRTRKISLGIDLGASRCGVSILIDDIPVIHSVMSWGELARLVKLLSRNYDIMLTVGSSPGITGLMNDFMEDVGPRVSVRFVDEEFASKKKNWFRSRYPYLSQDELDSLVYAFISAQRINAI